MGQIEDELSMLTGVVHPDVNYLYYLLMKDGSLFDTKKIVDEEPSFIESVPTLEEWFNEIGDKEDE